MTLLLDLAVDWLFIYLERLFRGGHPIAHIGSHKGVTVQLTYHSHRGGGGEGGGWGVDFPNQILPFLVV